MMVSGPFRFTKLNGPVDSRRSELDAASPKEVGDVIEKILLEFDQALGRLAGNFNGRSFLIISNNGKGPSGQAIQNINVILKRLCYMHRDSQDIRSLNSTSSNFFQEVEKYPPISLVEQVKNLLLRKVRNKWGRRLKHKASTWKNSRAFPLSNDISGAVLINLEAREAKGIVKVEDYDYLCEAINAGLHAIKSNEVTFQL